MFFIHPKSKMSDVQTSQPAERIVAKSKFSRKTDARKEHKTDDIPMNKKTFSSRSYHYAAPQDSEELKKLRKIIDTALVIEQDVSLNTYCCKIMLDCEKRGKFSLSDVVSKLIAMGDLEVGQATTVAPTYTLDTIGGIAEAAVSAEPSAEVAKPTPKFNLNVDNIVIGPENIMCFTGTAFPTILQNGKDVFCNPNQNELCGLLAKFISPKHRNEGRRLMKYFQAQGLTLTFPEALKADGKTKVRDRQPAYVGCLLHMLLGKKDQNVNVTYEQILKSLKNVPKNVGGTKKTIITLLGIQPETPKPAPESTPAPVEETKSELTSAPTLESILASMKEPTVQVASPESDVSTETDTNSETASTCNSDVEATTAEPI
jgi:hypothetical protein